MRPFKFCPLCGKPLTVQTQIGEERPTCPACGWVHYEDPKVAAGVVLVEDGKILLVRRFMQPHARQWTIPAGFVNAYEDPAEAAIRECREETGLTVELDGLLQMMTGREHPRGADIFLVYRGRVTGGDLVPADDADSAAWFELTDLPDLAFNSTHKIIDLLLTR